MSVKLRIAVSEEKYAALRDYLTERGVELGEDGEFLVTEASRYPAFLSARDEKRERVRLSAEEVLYFVAVAKATEIYTPAGVYFAQDRMYELEALLDPAKFIRVSKSVIVSGKHVKKIRPSLSMKFILTLSDGTLVDVTRSYYGDFRRFFNI